MSRRWKMFLLSRQKQIDNHKIGGYCATVFRIITFSTPQTETIPRS